MTVNPREAAATADYQARTYYFCSEECKEEFERNPQRYIAQKVR
jgi:YHS domain-containing protein